MNAKKRLVVDIGIIGLGNIGGALAQSLLGGARRSLRPASSVEFASSNTGREGDAASSSQKSVDQQRNLTGPDYCGFIDTPAINKLLVYECNQNLAKAKALDLAHAACAFDQGQPWSKLGQPRPQIHVAAQAGELASCDIVVITAGKTRAPGMTRDDLLQANAAIVAEIMSHLQGFSGILIMVTNPVDLMARLASQHLGLDGPRRVIGMAGQLDSGRLRFALSQTAKVDPDRIGGWVIGPHSDAMVPLRQSLTLDDGALKVDDAAWRDVVQQTRHAGATIGSLLGQGSAYYGPALAVRGMIDALLSPIPSVMACSVSSLWAGPDLVRRFPGLFWGQLVRLGGMTIQQGPELLLTNTEKAELDQGLQALAQQALRI